METGDAAGDAVEAVEAGDTVGVGLVMNDAGSQPISCFVYTRVYTERSAAEI